MGENETKVETPESTSEEPAILEPTEEETVRSATIWDYFHEIEIQIKDDPEIPLPEVITAALNSLLREYEENLDADTHLPPFRTSCDPVKFLTDMGCSQEEIERARADWTPEKQAEQRQREEAAYEKDCFNYQARQKRLEELRRLRKNMAENPEVLKNIINILAAPEPFAAAGLHPHIKEGESGQI